MCVCVCFNFCWSARVCMFVCLVGWWLSCACEKRGSVVVSCSIMLWLKDRVVRVVGETALLNRTVYTHNKNYTYLKPKHKTAAVPTTTAASLLIYTTPTPYTHAHQHSCAKTKVKNTHTHLHAHNTTPNLQHNFG